MIAKENKGNFTEWRTEYINPCNLGDNTVNLKSPPNLQETAPSKS